MYSRFCLVSILMKLIYAISLFINILGLSKHLPASGGPTLKCEIFGEESAIRKLRRRSVRSLAVVMSDL